MEGDGIAMNQITNWLIGVDGRIRGKRVSDGHDINTSTVVSRTGDVVTTKSGSLYQLDDSPHRMMTEQSMRNRLYGGTESVWSAVDWVIEKIAK